MIEPPQPGFTGVVWEAREPQRLATELTTGPGPMPMADAAAAWTRLAAAFGAAVLDYEQVLHTLRGSWQSGRSDEVWQRVSTLRDWLLETAAAATANAARMQAQVLAYEVAARAMPNSGDIAAIAAMQKAVEQIGTALGAPIKAIAAQTDAEADVAKAVASRVMRSYEAATEPLANPWLHVPPPPIVPEAALVAEQSGGQAASSATAPAMPGLGMMGGLGGLPVMPAPVQTAYRAPVFVQSGTAAVAPAAQPAPVAAATGHAAPVVPGAMAPAAAAQDAPRFPRAGLAYEESDQLVAEGEIQAAPAVLGVVERAAPQTGTAQSGGAA